MLQAELREQEAAAVVKNIKEMLEGNSDEEVSCATPPASQWAQGRSHVDRVLT